MLSRRHRFHGLNSLRTTYKQGQVVRNQHLNLRYNLNTRRPSYRCAVVVSKKVEKSAVGRNRLRRRIFEAVRQLEPSINQPYDLIIGVFNANLADLPSQALNRQIKDLLTKAGIIDAKKHL